MKRIVITGATGFIGRWFVDECLSHNDKVLLLVSSKSKIPERWHNKDNLNTIVLPMEEYSTATVNFEADIFFNFAWNGTSGIKRSNEKEQLDNISYACNAIELAKKLGAKTFVNAGSIMEYEAIDNLIKDGFIPDTNMIYSVAKITQDFICKIIANKEKIIYKNLLISNIYGVGEKSERFINYVLKKMINNEEINLSSCEQEYDFIYASDAAKAIYLVATKGKANESYYIGNSNLKKLKEFVIDMKNITKTNSKLNFGSKSALARGHCINNINTKKIENEFGFKPEVDFKTGITEVIKWLKENI